MSGAGRHDLIIVGGGVYGLTLALEATRRGRAPLLLEKGACGGATSAASLCILHGGLRYLQHLDLARALESVRARAWWQREFPELVRPLACLMPLHGRGLKRPAVLRAGLALNELLCRLGDGGRLPRGRVLDAGEVRARLPLAPPAGLAGGALWHDLFAPDMAALLAEIRRRAEAAGATVREGLEVRGALLEDGRIAGVRARHRASGEEAVLHAPLVVNAAGPWAAGVARACGAREAPAFHPLLAWNVVFERAPPSDHALAVTAPREGAQTWFLVPLGGRLVAGTGYAPWHGVADRVELPAAELERFVAEIDAALPGLGLRADEVRRVLAGLLPARGPGSAGFATRPQILDHGTRGGPAGLVSVVGVKLTTAPGLAARVLERADRGSS